MVDAKVATSAEQPINSDGAVAAEEIAEGDLVGLNGSGEIVAADADSGVQQPAIGVSAVSFDDPANYPSGDFEFAAKAAESQRNLVGDDKGGYILYGTEVYNRDEDWGFTPGEPVYLDVGGGFTQTKPSASSELVQAVGSAGPDGETVLLNVDADYETLA